jgi:hypothetical protein
MGGLSPESWPVLAAFLALQSAITLPLLIYIRTVNEARIADLKAQLGTMLAEKEAQIKLVQGVYGQATEYAQKRGDVLHAEKEALVKQLDANSAQMFRAVDALSELRDAVRELTRARQAS